MGRIIAVANQKGGVGKTTTVINLAAYLADSGKRVLAVDIDPQGNTTTGLGIEKHTVDASIYDVLLEGQPLMEALVPTDVVGLHLVPATMDLAGAEVDLSKADHREMRLKAALTIVKERYDYIFIDCPPSLGLLTVNALSISTMLSFTTVLLDFLPFSWNRLCISLPVSSLSKVLVVETVTRRYDRSFTGRSLWTISLHP
ncbi:MAG: hypothetical protein C7B44_14420 [Sulfobacillus thermosulfidooxidans]|nr:MAG: hypothetical protein C7B44_14420 [Sulfobacillus thermosulfidooxidans]